MFDEEETPNAMSEARRPRQKRAFQEHLNTVMLFVVGFIIAFMLMVAFVRISVNAEVDLLEVTYQTVLLYFCTVTVHIILRAYARRKGRETKKWTDAKEEVERNGRRIVEFDLVKKTSEYCRAWEEYDVNSLRERILKEVGLSLSDFNTYFNKYSLKEIAEKFPNITKEQMRAVKHAKRVKRLHYDENYLSAKERISMRRRSPSGGIKANTAVKIQTVELLFICGITSMFLVHMSADLILHFSYATVVICVVKLLMLVIFGAFGMHGGYKFSSVREVAEMEDRADEQRRFFRWCGEQEDKKSQSQSKKNEEAEE